MPRDRLEAVAGQLARRRSRSGARRRACRSARGPARRSRTRRRASSSLGDAAPRGALAQARRPDAAERERHAERARAAVEKRQIEAVQVVVLDDVGIGRLRRARRAGGSDPPRRRRPSPCASSISVAPVGIAHGDHEDAIARGVEPGRLEIELQAAQLVEGEIAKVRAPGRDEVLLLGRQREHALVPSSRRWPTRRPRRRDAPCSTADVSVARRRRGRDSAARPGRRARGR